MYLNTNKKCKTDISIYLFGGLLHFPFEDISGNLCDFSSDILQTFVDVYMREMHHFVVNSFVVNNYIKGISI